MASPSSAPASRIAIVGAGITGAVAASCIAQAVSNVHITLYDQGRRGPGGRASHRCLHNGLVLPDDPPVTVPCHEFDHGCQFFRADSAEMKEFAALWEARGWAQKWNCRFGGDGDFFGVPTCDALVYCGYGGMHTLPRSILRACDTKTVSVQVGARVASIEDAVCAGGANARWALFGVSGEAAYHDSPEAQARAAENTLLGYFDIVIFTDISSSFGAWHRASASVPECFAARVRDRVRMPLFSAMVAFDRPLMLPLDAFALADATSGGSGDGGGGDCVAAGGNHHTTVLWWAARTQSKPGLERSGAHDGSETWTLISTPGFAVAEIQAVPMQDATTGAFKPQEGGYLNGAGGPSQALVAAFKTHAARLVGKSGRYGTSSSAAAGGSKLAEEDAFNGAKVVYIQGQRWGSALPAPSSVADRDCNGRSHSTVSVLGTEYEGGMSVPLVFERPSRAGDRGEDYIADDDMRLYYAGDFCSRRNPGFEAAALSGADVAEHIARVVLATRA